MVPQFNIGSKVPGSDAPLCEGHRKKGCLFFGFPLCQSPQQFHFFLFDLVPSLEDSSKLEQVQFAKDALEAKRRLRNFAKGQALHAKRDS